LKALLLAGEVLHADETTVQVLKEEGKKPESKSYMWLYRTGSDAQHPIVLFEYQPNRKHENASRFLSGFKGFVHSDGYGAYHNLPPGITPVGCWAHVRRKFADILKSLPDYNKQGSISMRGKEFCDALFALERGFADLSFEERRKARLVHSQPMMDEFFAWAQKTTNHILATPRSVMGKALAYALGERKYLENILLDGRCEISNNRAERSIRPFTIGRKNWIFSNTEKGATASALIYSIIETAKENNLKPYEYLKYVFETAPNIDLQCHAELEKLLPWNAPAACHAPIQLTMNGAAPR
ncbi:MAG: IS66 family transposase, partial [Eubacteriales bacterium]|nr:IS66 family transposase [Eubacteriales bacterium]